MSEKRCPNCGRHMKQQFIGLHHCKCGVSWKKHEGYFVRTPDMVFALERRWVGNKRKQVPVIRYKTGMQGDSGAPAQGTPTKRDGTGFHTCAALFILGGGKLPDGRSA